MNDSKNQKDSLIDLMVEETFGAHEPTDHTNEQSLDDYFQMRLKGPSSGPELQTVYSYLMPYQLNSLKIEYLNETQCYRIEQEFKVLDFPSNWSLFARLNELEQSDFIEINSENNDDFLFEILQNFDAAASRFVICLDSAGSPTLFAFSKQHEQTFEILKGVFSLLNSGYELIAA